MKRIVLLFFCLGWILTPSYSQQKKEIQFKHIFNGIFTTDGVRNVNWMKDGRYFTALERSDRDLELRKYDIISGEFEVLVGTSQLKSEERKQPLVIQDYQFSADETKLLIKTDVERIWRRSTRENYFVYDLDSGSLIKLTDSKDKQQFAEFSPAGDKAAFVLHNDLYWVDLTTGKETRITNDGEQNKIINGATDWVYEEEFAFAKAWYWSPDGNKIAFYHFKEARVKQFFMTDWGKLYPELTEFKYPKAGEKNSIVKIGVCNLRNGEITWMDIGEETDQYIPRINWTSHSNQLAIRRMNRLQNRQDLLLADVETGHSKIIKTETSESWIDVNDDLTFLDNGDQFIYVSEETGYNHIYLYDVNGNLIRQITEGDWEVTEFLGYNEKRGLIYYESTEESPLERHLYRINLDGTGKSRMTEGEGWHEINMSRDFSYYIESYSAPDLPPQFTLHRWNGDEVRVLENNEELEEHILAFNLPKKEYLTIELTQASLNAYMLKPYDFDPDKKYPVLVYVYGGPGSQRVTKEYASRQRDLWHNYLTSKGYIIVSIDNRGTGARGRDFEKQVYKKLGQYEVIDQIDAVKYLVEQHSYLDSNRIGIWGWSYGGYMSSLVLAEGNDLFKMAIAVAPVTDWKFYDTIYTERYMQTPELNPEGYKIGSPLNVAGKIRGDYLLVHGTGDDNVHFQNTVEMINELVKHDVSFKTMFYPDRNHGIYGGNTRRHLYRMMTDFVMENL